MSAPGLKITNFHYGHMAMPAPDPQLSDYPKMIYDKPFGAGRLVHSAEEEAALAGHVDVALPEYVPIAPPPPAVTLTGDNDEKTVLLTLAKERGIKVDARWRIEKIRAAMEAAQPKVEG